MSTSRELFTRLSGDRRRVSHPFSDDILQANALLHNTAATEDEMAECLFMWCQHRQPCQFGKAAAKQRRIHFCFLTEVAVSQWNDDEIAEKISDEKRLWKQRALADPQRAAHSFVLLVASPHVAFAAPDQHLRAFSDKILELSGWDNRRRGVRRLNTITSDFLYLRDPSDGAIYGFQFNADFFACAADGRWWADHRFPGGIAFTANSTGHMMRFRDWYQGKDQNEAWALKQAMLTIQNAAPTKTTSSSDPVQQGCATWLRSLGASGMPLVERSRCPVERMPTMLEGKDWTRYEGVLHTDHAVREEFFVDCEVAPTLTRPYLMDFTYLYDADRPDFKDFAGGKRFDEATVYQEIGRPEDWTHRAAAVGQRRTEEQAATVAEQLVLCSRWAAPPWHVGDDEAEIT